MTTAVRARAVGEVLAWSGGLLEPALRSAVDRLTGQTRLVAGYQLGWWDRDGSATDGVAGKALRPTLVLLSAQAAGGAAEDALDGAVAVELVHNFSLLQDDVLDGDLLRRGRPTAWSVFGVGSAILAGDALATLAVDELVRGRHARVLDCVTILNAVVQRLIDGQIADIAFESRDDVTLDECVAMASNKTAALLGGSCQLGGLLGGGSERQVADLLAFGEELGMAFQLVDDILGIWGDPAVTGKAAGSDLTSRKKSLPVVAALVSGTLDATELATLYGGTEQLSADEVARARELVESSGARAWTEAEANRRCGEALAQLEGGGFGACAAAELRAVADLVASRDR